MEGALSSSRNITAGVPQGAILAPALYALYINDIPTTPQVETALFADDTALFSALKSGNFAVRALQRGLTAVADWCALWNIKINEEKTAYVLFTAKRRLPTVELVLNNIILVPTNNVKYLGVTLDKRLTWSTHIHRVRGRALGSLRTLYTLFKSNRLKASTKLVLYQVIVRSAMLYACSVWGAAAHTHLKTLQIVQNKILRAISDAPRHTRNRDIHRALNITEITPYIDNRITINTNLIQNHPCPHIRDINLIAPPHRKRIRRRPRLQ